MKVVITGATGNVGTGVLRALAADREGHEVVGVCRRPPDHVPPYDGAAWVPCDLGDTSAPEVLAGAFAGADAVVHLAWMFQPLRRGEQVHRTNYTGTLAVLEAAKRAGVPHVVQASSIAAYAPAARGVDPVDEDWPTTGVPGSVYGQGKAEVEALLRRFAEDNPDTVVSVVRPTLVAQREASASFLALFFDPITPRWLLRLVAGGGLPVLPLPADLRVQLVHADDVGDAVVRILRHRAPGAFNLAADTITAKDLAHLAGARLLPIPGRLVRAAVGVLWRLHAVRMSPGWFDVGTRSPLVDTGRARAELSWVARVSSLDAAREQLAGLADGVEGGSPALHRDRLRGATTPALT
ncbi:NAD-dependent epimerase/dehydratase family protein [Saccharothrix syringae]|uniref:NAD-dependent epimerase/dehydratase family protein n=1 Tax=Saccharothrix syringae TaxID=103733 RepID=A0A5Q0H749_SACSY|nr:NAD-dependent epimerase/dehydratase family protein [Saccharothrix syringae]QFZ21725.1 NAD-dependent epimerase/dehydratase family protein [Saccharothrix syringae]